jgi:zinc protease
VLIALGLVWQSPASALTPRHYDDLKFAPLAELKIPPFERYQLANGLVVYLMENHELPLVSGTATFRTGFALNRPARLVWLLLQEKRCVWGDSKACS